MTPPPMPPDPSELDARAVAVGQTLRLVKRLVPAGDMVGLSPEGQAVRDAHLKEAMHMSPAQHYPEPTVGALIFDPAGRLFLMRSHKWADKYVVPGGHVELGETLEAALRREVTEETGLAIFDITFVVAQEFLYDRAFWKPRHFIFFDYACRTDSTEARLNDEAQEYVWATVDEALRLPVEPYTEKAIRTYLAQHANREQRAPADDGAAHVIPAGPTNRPVLANKADIALGSERLTAMPQSLPPALQARYVHTNLIARDWQALARFYETVFGCERVPPERDLAGPAIEAGTGLPAAHLRGVHLRLPGHGDAGPTLEIFAYDRLAERPAVAVNRPGFGHLAFSVADVAAAQAAVLAAGGRPVGEVVTVAVAGGGRITWCYVTDPEGNVIELQSWAGCGDQGGPHDGGSRRRSAAHHPTST